jgi:IS5 family transposase
VKLLTKIIKRCRKIASDEGISLRRSFKRELPGLLLQRFKSNRIVKRIRTMAGVLIRELERKLSREALARHWENLQHFRRVHGQKQTDKNKVYSPHEPNVPCIGIGKEHKKYEFGRKASIVVTKTTGFIVGALSFTENVYDGNTLPEVLEQTWQITEACPQVAICDRGYRGRTRVGDTEILTPRRSKKRDTPSQRHKARESFLETSRD